MNQSDKFSAILDNQTSAPNYDLETSDIIATLEAWDQIYGLEILEADEDTISLKFDSLPSELDQLVQEIYSFCPDIVDQGYELVPEMIANADALTEDAIAEFKNLMEDIDTNAPNLGLLLLTKKLRLDQKLDFWWD